MSTFASKQLHLGGVIVLEVTGRIDSSCAAEFDQELSQVIAGGATNVLIDLQGVDYLSSAALRVFLVAEKQLSAVGGKLNLCGPQPHVREVFQISGFDAYCTIPESKEAYFEQKVIGQPLETTADSSLVENKKVVLKYLMLIQLCQYHDLINVTFEGMKTTHTPSLVVGNDDNRLATSRQYSEYLDSLGREIEIEVKSMVAEGDTVAVYNITTHKYKDGRQMSTPWLSFYTLKDRKIVEAVHVLDRLHEQSQLAAKPAAIAAN